LVARGKRHASGPRRALHLSVFDPGCERSSSIAR
jgi:hypothetical protein